MTRPRLTLLYPGAIAINYEKNRRAELSIGTGELHFNKYKVLTNQNKIVTSKRWSNGAVLLS